MKDTVGILGVGQIAVRAADLERATSFYRDVLGLPHLFTAGNMAFLRCGDVRLMLAVPERPELDHPASVLYLHVEDIARAHRTLAGNGVRFQEEPHVAHRAPDHELWLAFFRDSEENILALMSERPTRA